MKYNEINFRLYLDIGLELKIHKQNCSRFLINLESVEKKRKCLNQE